MLSLLRSLFRIRPGDDPLTPVRDRSDFEAVLAASDVRPVLLYKHSTRCAYSATARRVVRSLDGAADPPIHEVRLPRQRALSGHIEDVLGVFHQTPQLILIHGRRAVWSGSHGQIRPETLREKLISLASAPEDVSHA